MQGSGSGAPIHPVSALEAEISRVLAELAQLRGVGQEADLPCGPSVKRVCRTGERVPIPPIPTLVPAELSAWLEERLSDDQRDAQLSALPPPWRAVGARCGLRGERVGEASNPGPRLLRRYRRGMKSARAVEISSEEEPLVPVRNVVPRLVGETVTTSPLETVPASQSDLATVGVQHSVDVPFVSNSFPVGTRGARAHLAGS